MIENTDFRAWRCTKTEINISTRREYASTTATEDKAILAYDHTVLRNDTQLASFQQNK